MAVRLVAIILVLAVCRGLPDLARLRDFTWFHAWLARIGRQNATTVLLAGIGLPALLVALIEAGLDRVLLGLFGLALGASRALLLLGTARSGTRRRSRGQGAR